MIKSLLQQRLFEKKGQLDHFILATFIAAIGQLRRATVNAHSIRNQTALAQLSDRILIQ